MSSQLSIYVSSHEAISVESGLFLDSLAKEIKLRLPEFGVYGVSIGRDELPKFAVSFPSGSGWAEITLKGGRLSIISAFGGLRTIDMNNPKFSIEDLCATIHEMHEEWRRRTRRVMGGSSVHL